MGLEPEIPAAEAAEILAGGLTAVGSGSSDGFDGFEGASVEVGASRPEEVTDGPEMAMIAGMSGSVD